MPLSKGAKAGLALGGTLLIAGGIGAIGFVLYKQTHKTVIPPSEVYHVIRDDGKTTISSSEAVSIAKNFGGTVATKTQLTDALASGAQWCSSGWTAENDGVTIKNAMFPMVKPPEGVSGCGSPNSLTTCGPDLCKMIGVNVYGPKPKKDTKAKGFTVHYFDDFNGIWNDPSISV